MYYIAHRAMISLMAVIALPGREWAQSLSYPLCLIVLMLTNQSAGTHVSS